MDSTYQDIFCLDCGYALSDIDERKCPQCERPYDPYDASTVDTKPTEKAQPQWLDRELFGELEYGRCYNCGYNLKGLANKGNCPECGREYTEESASQRKPWPGKRHPLAVLLAGFFGLVGGVYTGWWSMIIYGFLGLPYYSFLVLFGLCAFIAGGAVAASIGALLARICGAGLTRNFRLLFRVAVAGFIWFIIVFIALSASSRPGLELSLLGFGMMFLGAFVNWKRVGRTVDKLSRR